MRLAAIALAVILAAASAGAQTSKAAPAAPKAAATPKAKPPAPAPAQPSPEFDKLVASAAEARQANNWEDAIALYAKAVKLKPAYVEGYWYQGTSYYSLSKFPECRDKFRDVIRLAPKNGAAFAFLGLCEFEVKEYDHAIDDLLKSRIYGAGDTGDLVGIARYHLAILMARIGQYEQALQTLGEFANQGVDNELVIEAMGIATLRMPMFPDEVPADRREMVIMAGRGSYQMATRNTAAASKSFEALALRYPETPNVHHAYGVYLLLDRPDKAIEEFKKELELQPGNPASLMQIAFEYLKRGDAQAALPWAKQAVAAAPAEFPAHKALGQALLETGDVDGAIAELQMGLKLAPESPSLHFTLARALQKAGRLEEANKERDEFTRLDRIAREQRSGVQSVGGTGGRGSGGAR